MILILLDCRVDLAHLVLYHLSLCCKRKYFDFDHEIMSFANENWESLLLGTVGNIVNNTDTAQFKVNMKHQMQPILLLLSGIFMNETGYLPEIGLCVCMCVCACVCVCVCARACVRVYIYIYIYICMYVWRVWFQNAINGKKKCYEFPPKSISYLVGIEKSIFFYWKCDIVLLCHVFSQTNASLLSLQNAINPLNQSQRTIPCTVDSTGNGGALNTAGILVFLIYFVLSDQQTKNN